MAETKDIFTYKGKPMVRRGDTIYYGDLNEKYIIIFTIKSKKKVGDLEVADSVTIDLCTNRGAGKEKVIKKANRESLYEAIDIAEFWLEDAIENG
ncbi:MAG: hypothetical protein IJN36_02975 [Clostridia bacterium]|nr:hypothetical protein [Clostridia bacterium]MBR2885418.1 hypothetical protein [Clostridia bacterium]